MKDEIQNSLFIRACYRQPVERTPVWMMRQAGRYLPQYRAVREKHDFITMYKTPELAAEVTLQPIDILEVDAAILFSDILVVPEAMGMELQFIEGKGPLFPRPIRSAEQVKELHSLDPRENLDFVLKAIRICREELAGRVPLIGFSGAPWTLATYMIEGQGSKNFQHIKTWRYGNPALLHELLDKIAVAVSRYLNAQIEAGAQAIQLFDTWAGILDGEGFREFVLPYVTRIIQEIRKPGVPVIYFAKGAGVWLDDLTECGADVLGLDWTMDMGFVRQRVGERFALQGNLDPVALLASPEVIRQEVRKILSKFGRGSGHIFNLGHGILPQVPPNHAQAFVQAVKEESVQFHQ
ncbi:MAG: uroporphyrinogen decarboxylase [Calditrichia bacterium]